MSDEKTNGQDRPASFVPPSKRRLYDSDVTFEEYLHYAKLTRAEEDANPEETKAGLLDQIRFRKPKKTETAAGEIETKVGDHKLPNGDQADYSSGNNGSADGKTTDEPSHKSKRPSILKNDHIPVTDEEWKNASRMLRTASWGAGFYLITTDVLGPYGVGFALGTLGWGPGIVLYTIFGFMAGYSGYLLWSVYLGLDSYEFPIRNYGDLAFRCWGSIPRYCVNVLQSLLLLLICGQVIILNGQGISQTSKFRLCYVVCVILFVIAGWGIGQVRTLRNYGMLTVLAVCINLMVIFISMGVMAHSPPNYEISVLGSAGSAVGDDSIKPDAQGNYPPVRHYNGLPDPNSLIGSLNGLMQGVFAYGGAQIYPEIIAEMRRPWDFIKSVCCAQLFIWAVYLIYGCYVYYWQGQYSFQISYIGLSVYGFQATCDMMAVISGLIAAGLYGNIGIKVLYNNVFMEIFKAPPITTKTGKFLFRAIVPIYWSIAFVVAAAIPDYFGFVSVISGFCVIPFSYAFPPMLHLAYSMQKDSITGSDGFDPHTGITSRNDRGVKRWLRGFWSGQWYMKYMNIWHVVYAGGSLAICGLGCYVAIVGMIDAFKMPQVNAFTCTSPLNLSPG